VEQGSKQLLISPNLGQFGEHALIEFDSVVRSEIAQPIILQPTPERLDRVEHRCVWRQFLQGDPIGVHLLRLTNWIPLCMAPPSQTTTTRPGTATSSASRKAATFQGLKKSLTKVWK